MSLRLTRDDLWLLTSQVKWLCVDGHSGWYTVWSDGITIPVITGGDGEGDDGSDGNDDDDDDSDSDDDNDDDDDGDDDKSSKSKSASASEKQRLSAEAKKYRLQRNKERDEKAALAAENKALKDATLKDDEKKDARIKELEDQLKATEAVSEKLQTLTLKDALRTAADEAKLRFDDSEEAMLIIMNKKKYRDLIEVDDDGEVSGMEEAVKALAKDKPRLLIASGKDESDDDDDDDASNGNGSGAAKKSADKSFGGKKKGSGMDRAALEAKFPALRR